MPNRVSSLALLTAVVTKILLPQTTGLEWARPGIASFQRTFCAAVASHFTGWPGLSTTPVASGPRNCGQFCGGVFCAGTVPAITEIRTRESKSRFIVTSEFLLDALQLAGVLALLESHTDDFVGFESERESYSAES